MGRQPNRSRGGNNLSISDTFHNKHNSYNSKTFSSSARSNKLGKHNPKRNKRYSEEKEFEEADDDDDEEDEEPTGVTRCICKLQHGDGVMIQCEECEVWQHIVCVNIPESEIPEKYFCEQCRPDLHPYLSKNEKPLPVKKSHKKPPAPITNTINQTLPNNSIVTAISKVKSLSLSASSSQKPKSTSNTPHQLDSPPSQIFTTRSGRQTAIRNKGTYLEVPEDADIDQVTEITEEALLANAEKKSQSSRRSKRSSPKPMSATVMAGPLSMSKASSNNSSNSLRRLDTYKNSIYPREMPNFPNFDALNEFFSPPIQAPKPPTYNPAPANSNKKKGNKRKSTPPPRARNVHARSQLNAIMIRADRMLGHCDVMVKELEETGLSILNPVKLNTLATGQNCIEAIEGLKRKLQNYKDQYENIRSRKEIKMD